MACVWVGAGPPRWEHSSTQDASSACPLPSGLRAGKCSGPTGPGGCPHAPWRKRCLLSPQRAGPPCALLKEPRRSPPLTFSSAGKYVLSLLSPCALSPPT